MNKKAKEMPMTMLMQQITHLMRYQAVPVFKQQGINPGSVGILMLLSKRGEMSQRQLAKEMGVTPPSMTVALRKLEKQGFIIRNSDPRDQRMIQIGLLEEGKQCVEQVKQSVKALEGAVFADFSQEEKLLFRRLLVQMYENILNVSGLREEDLKKPFRRMKGEGENR